MPKDKKLVDLIYLEKNILEFQLKAEYQTRIATWFDWLSKRQNDDLVIEDSYIEEQTEYLIIENLLDKFLNKRLKWILSSVKESELRSRYLSVLPPFSQEGDIKKFLLHFFQLKDHPQSKNLAFCFLNRSERELRILWDVFKLTKTIESVETIKQSIEKKPLFPSCFSRDQVQDTLNTLLDVLKLMVQICIKRKFHDQVLLDFPLDVFQPGSLLKRKEENDFWVNDMVLEKFDYRNYFFNLYFRPTMKLVYEERELNFRFNYLDYEILRQEFLIDWIHGKLSNNPNKTNVLSRYMVGNRTFSQVIKKNPDMEISLLKQLPKIVFDDMIADVNRSVDKNLQTPIDPMSEKYGEFALLSRTFEKAKELSQKSIRAIQEFLKEKKKKEFPPINIELPPVSLVRKPQYKITRLKKEEVNFPYFCTNNARFQRQHALLQSKMGPEVFQPFDHKIGEFFSKISEISLIKRRTPRHEWAIPYLIEETLEKETIMQLLIIGAEVRNKPLAMGYKSGHEAEHDFKAYFVYGSLNQIPEMGSPEEERTIKGRQYFVYESLLSNVIRKAMELTDILLKKKLS